MSPKITIHKTVFWNAGGRVMTGKVKQIMSDHAVIASEGTDYIVQKASLSTKPFGKIASMVSNAAMKDKPKAPTGIEWTFDPATGDWNVKWIDPTGEAGVQGCDASLHPEIGECDGIWVEDTISAETRLNPELFRGGPKAPPPAQSTQVKGPAAPQAQPLPNAPVRSPGVFAPPQKAPAKPNVLPPQRRLDKM